MSENQTAFNLIADTTKAAVPVNYIKVLVVIRQISDKHSSS